MDGHFGHSTALLTRSNSSLLRSSPTIRSSIHSLSSISHEHHLFVHSGDTNAVDFEEEEDYKKKMPPRGCPVIPPSSFRLASAALLSSLVFSSAFYVSFFYWRKDGMPASENLLLLSLIFIAAVLYFLSRNRPFIHRNLSILKSLCVTNSDRLCLSRGSSKSVLWFIGDLKGHPSTMSLTKEGKKKVIREGVEFYSSGDFYEGEFHKGKCNGSGVYNYFAKGRYEGDWVDGKYDGYGVESWARGSKYRGMYRKGLRHGCGIYRFYTGDSYSGEWWNGQSHGIGLQSCKDGSCYIGEFKCGMKHGLGCYYFRYMDGGVVF